MTKADSANQFGEAERMLLGEARARFEFEQRASGALHARSTLYLAICGVFAASIGATLGRVLDGFSGSAIEGGAVATLGLALGIITLAGLLLARSALSRSYQVIAKPSKWVHHLEELRRASVGNNNAATSIVAQLQLDLLDAWIEAAEGCADANRQKADSLERVSKLLFVGLPTTFLGVILLLARVVLR